MPFSSFEKQIEEHNKEIALKILSNEIILGKSTENTAMELDAERSASFEQLQELIKKESDKRVKKYRSLEQKYNKLQESLEHSQQKKTCQWGAREAPQTKRNHNRQNNEGWPPNAVAPLRGDALGHIPAQTEKLKVPTTTPQATIWKSNKVTGAHDHNRRKVYQLRSEQVTTSIENKLKQQFGFVADP